MACEIAMFINNLDVQPERTQMAWKVLEAMKNLSE